jgi:hypothetical protein
MVDEQQEDCGMNDNDDGGGEAAADAAARLGMWMVTIGGDVKGRAEILTAFHAALKCDAEMRWLLADRDVFSGILETIPDRARVQLNLAFVPYSGASFLAAMRGHQESRDILLDPDVIEHNAPEYTDIPALLLLSERFRVFSAAEPRDGKAKSSDIDQSMPVLAASCAWHEYDRAPSSTADASCGWHECDRAFASAALADPSGKRHAKLSAEAESKSKLSAEAESKSGLKIDAKQSAGDGLEIGDAERRMDGGSRVSTRRRIGLDSLPSLREYLRRLSPAAPEWKKVQTMLVAALVVVISKTNEPRATDVNHLVADIVNLMRDDGSGLDLTMPCNSECIAFLQGRVDLIQDLRGRHLWHIIRVFNSGAATRPAPTITSRTWDDVLETIMMTYSSSAMALQRMRTQRLAIVYAHRRALSVLLLGPTKPIQFVAQATHSLRTPALPLGGGPSVLLLGPTKPIQFIAQVTHSLRTPALALGGAPFAKPSLPLPPSALSLHTASVGARSSLASRLPPSALSVHMASVGAGSSLASMRSELSPLVSVQTGSVGVGSSLASMWSESGSFLAPVAWSRTVELGVVRWEHGEFWKVLPRVLIQLVLKYVLPCLDERILSNAACDLGYWGTDESLPDELDSVLMMRLQASLGATPPLGLINESNTGPIYSGRPAQLGHDSREAALLWYGLYSTLRCARAPKYWLSDPAFWTSNSPFGVSWYEHQLRESSIGRPFLIPTTTAEMMALTNDARAHATVLAHLDVSAASIASNARLLMLMILGERPSVMAKQRRLVERRRASPHRTVEMGTTYNPLFAMRLFWPRLIAHIGSSPDGCVIIRNPRYGISAAFLLKMIVCIGSDWTAESVSVDDHVAALEGVLVRSCDHYGAGYDPTMPIDLAILRHFLPTASSGLPTPAHPLLTPPNDQKSTTACASTIVSGSTQSGSMQSGGARRKMVRPKRPLSRSLRHRTPQKTTPVPSVTNDMVNETPQLRPVTKDVVNNVAQPNLAHAQAGPTTSANNVAQPNLADAQAGSTTSRNGSAAVGLPGFATRCIEEMEKHATGGNISLSVALRACLATLDDPAHIWQRRLLKRILTQFEMRLTKIAHSRHCLPSIFRPTLARHAVDRLQPATTLADRLQPATTLAGRPLIASLEIAAGDGFVPSPMMTLAGHPLIASQGIAGGDCFVSAPMMTLPDRHLMGSQGSAGGDSSVAINALSVGYGVRGGWTLVHHLPELVCANVMAYVDRPALYDERQLCVAGRSESVRRWRATLCSTLMAAGRASHATQCGTLGEDEDGPSTAIHFHEAVSTARSAFRRALDLHLCDRPGTMPSRSWYGAKNVKVRKLLDEFDCMGSTVAINSAIGEIMLGMCEEEKKSARKPLATSNRHKRATEMSSRSAAHPPIAIVGNDPNQLVESSFLTSFIAYLV